jgi:hypothetical protein
MAHLNAGCPRTAYTPVNEDAAVDKCHGEAHMMHQSWYYPNRWPPEILYDNELYSTIAHGAHICFHAIVFYRCNFADSCDMITL